MMLLLVPCPPQRSTIGAGSGNAEQWFSWWLQVPSFAGGGGGTDNSAWQFLGTWHQEGVALDSTEGRGQWAVGS